MCALFGSISFAGVSWKAMASVDTTAAKRITRSIMRFREAEFYSWRS